MRRKAQEEHQRPKRSAAVSALAGLPERTLLRMVHHLMPERAARIENVLNRAHQSQVFTSEFRKVFQHLGISERTFASLVVLSAFDPSPLSPGDLAYHTNTRLRGIAATLRLLEDTGCAIRSHAADRRGRTFVRLSRHGRGFAAHAVRQYLETADRLSVSQPDTDSVPSPSPHPQPTST